MGGAYHQPIWSAERPALTVESEAVLKGCAELDCYVGQTFTRWAGQGSECTVESRCGGVVSAAGLRKWVPRGEWVRQIRQLTALVGQPDRVRAI
jgi:hypothetical protein